MSMYPMMTQPISVNVETVITKGTKMPAILSIMKNGKKIEMKAQIKDARWYSPANCCIGAFDVCASSTNLTI